MDRQTALPRSAPEAQGIASAGVNAFLNAAEAQFGGLHDFMLLRHGCAVAEGAWSPYRMQDPHMLYSLSKSFTSTAVGLAVTEGRLSVDDSVLSFFPNDAPAEVSPNLAAMRVRHLLSMSSGHSKDALDRGQENWARGFLAQPVEHPPGTHFVYNNGATYMLSAIVQRLTGETLRQYLEPRLFAPLGIDGPSWDTCPGGINVGASGLSVKIEDIARFGQLYLQKGLWNGARILPEAWIDEATSRHVSNGTEPDSDWQQGYGYQFWRGRHGAYRGDGAFGQFCIVMPAQDVVVAITSGAGNMQALLNLVWEHLLAAMRPAPLPESADAGSLAEKLGSLSLPVAEGSPSSPAAARVSGRTYRFEPNDQKLEAATLELDGPRCRLALRDDRGEHRIDSEFGRWLPGTTTLDERGPLKVAASGAWTSEDTFEMRLCYTETPFRPTLTFQFNGDRLLYDHKVNVAFGPTDRPQLVGRMAAGAGG